MKRLIGNLALVVATVMSGLVAFHQSGWNTDRIALIFDGWVILPYVFCGVLSHPLYREGRAKYSSLALWFPVALLLFAGFAYSSLYFGRQSSTGAPIFLFAPMYQIVASGLVLGWANIRCASANCRTNG